MSKWTRRTLIALTVLLSVFALVNIHEIGHVVIARLMGASDAAYYLYTRGDDGSTIIGYTFYGSGSLLPQALVVIKVGGLMFTQATAILLLTVRGVWLTDWFKRRLTAVAAIVFIFDFPWQVWQGVGADVQNQAGIRGVDLADFIYLINSEFDVNIALLKAGLLISLLLYLPLIVWLYRLGNKQPD
jgi:hypothetical protein